MVVTVGASLTAVTVTPLVARFEPSPPSSTAKVAVRADVFGFSLVFWYRTSRRAVWNSVIDAGPLKVIVPVAVSKGPAVIAGGRPAARLRTSSPVW